MLRGDGVAGLGRWVSRGLIALAIAMIAPAIAATSAHAETTRAEFVAQVDPICQAGQAQEAVAAQSLARAMKRAKKHHQLQGSKKLKRAFNSYFAQYVAIEHSVNDQIATVPPAPDDVSLIQVWLRARNELLDLETKLFTARPKKANAQKFFAFFVQFLGLAYETSDLVRDFGFQYCSAGNPVVVIGGFGR